MPAILTQGLTEMRNSLATLVTHVGIATDTTAFAVGQTAIDPANGGAGNLLIKASTAANVDATTVDESITVTGASEFTNKTIFTISACDGATRTDALTRTVRSLGIGVIDGDVYTIAVRLSVEDETP